uniref:GPI inositol-deacylase n=1 Tax=Proteus terrae TaxID=1574161 RepID=UPI001CBEA918
WQVYYPTNLPLALNNQEIRQALAATLAHFDPKGTHVASRDMVLLGHSMGGVLARLMVSDSGDELWNALIKPQNLSERRRERL